MDEAARVAVPSLRADPAPQPLRRRGHRRRPSPPAVPGGGRACVRLAVVALRAVAARCVLRWGWTRLLRVPAMEPRATIRRCRRVWHNLVRMAGNELEGKIHRVDPEFAS
jgi:hypothetical protein